MSSLEESIIGAQVRFQLLQRIHPVFDACLPTIDEAENGRYGTFNEELWDEITLLRTDIKCMPIRLHQMQFDQIEDDIHADRLVKAFDDLLTLFEDSVHSIKTQTSITASKVGLSRHWPLLWYHFEHFPSNHLFHRNRPSG